METYRTSDFYLAAFLKAKGLRLLDKQRMEGKVIFIFNDRPDRKALIQEFFNDGVVGVAAFKNAIQDLKTIVFSM